MSGRGRPKVLMNLELEISARVGRAQLDGLSWTRMEGKPRCICASARRRQ